MSALNDIRIYDWMEIFVAYLKTLFRITENHKLYNEVTTKSTADKYLSDPPLDTTPRLCHQRLPSWP